LFTKKSLRIYSLRCPAFAEELLIAKYRRRITESKDVCTIDGCLGTLPETSHQLALLYAELHIRLIHFAVLIASGIAPAK